MKKAALFSSLLAACGGFALGEPVIQSTASQKGQLDLLYVFLFVFLFLALLFGWRTGLNITLILFLVMLAIFVFLMFMAYTAH